MPAPLDPTTVEVRLGKVDGKTSDKLSVPGTLTLAQNAEMRTTGRYQRRPGTIHLDTLAGATRLHSGERELLIGTAAALYSDIDGAFDNRGSIAGLRSRHTPINQSSFEQLSHDMLQLGGLDFHVWAEDSGIFYCVRDSETGAYIVVDGVVTTATQRINPRVVQGGPTTVFITYAKGDQADSGITQGLFCRKIDTTAPATVSGESTIIAAGSWFVRIGTAYDVVYKSGTTVCLAYLALPTVNVVLRLQEWDTSTMTSSATLDSASLSASPTSGMVNYVVAFFKGDQSAGYTLALARKPNVTDAITGFLRKVTAAAGLGGSQTHTAVWTTTAATGEDFDQVTGFVDGNGDTQILASLLSSAASTRSQLWRVQRTAGGVNSGPFIRYGFRLVTKIFTFASQDLVLASAGITLSTGQEDRTLYLIEAVSAAILGRALPSLAAASTANRGSLPVPTVLADYVLVAAEFFATTVQQSACDVRIDPQLPARWLEVAGVTLVPGSTIYCYDGTGVSELGFFHPPSFTAASIAAGGPGAGSYYYRATWAWTDAQGRLHRSDASQAILHSLAGTDHSRITLDTLNATLKAAPVQQAVFELWRTVVNPSAAGAAAFYFIVAVANDPTVDTQTIDDFVTDTVLVTGERLYTLGNTVLGNATPPPANCLATWNNRVWAAERDLLWFTKEITDGLGLAWPAENFLQVTDDRGDITAIADAGQRFLIAKRTALYVLSGDGPTDTGQGAFSPIRRLPFALGARSSLSTVSTELGVFFQDDASGVIWLLPPDGNPVAVGREVEDLSTDLTITDAVVVPARRQVRFMSSDGITLVYDMANQLWSVYTEQAAVAGATVDDVFGYVASGGSIRFDDEDTWVEGSGSENQPYTMVLETNWLSPNQVAGYARFFAAVATGALIGEHVLAVKVRYRYDDGTEDEADLDSTTMSEAAGYRVEARAHLRNQLAGAVRIRIEDDAPQTAGAALEALLLIVGLRPGRLRLPKVNVATPP